jgi:hypothetical protein
MPQLTPAQQMFLQYGPAFRWADAFRDEDECRAAWTCNRDRLLAGYPPGRRPIAWWRFEVRVAYPGYDREPVVLYESEFIGAEERAALERGWCREFARAHGPHFFHCEAGRILKGAAGRRAHYRWAGIPRDLLKRWTRERRRQSHTIRKLETAGNSTVAPVPPAV